MRFFRSFSLKGLSLFEMMVAVSIILIFKAIYLEIGNYLYSYKLDTTNKKI
jgi:prepilin-type N-terminal cleavage/methylation domain-containing protein